MKTLYEPFSRSGTTSSGRVGLKSALLRWIMAGLLITSYSSAWAKSVVPPDDPRQSITYWKPHTISADKDPLVAKTQAVFSVLLRAWDSSRLEPTLYVVDSVAGPWAASLSDGNILLSRAAIKASMKFGDERAEHLLAFILAHELAHQRSDDLWHQRFFRLIGNQAPEIKRKMLRGLKTDSKLWINVAQKEVQADRDGLIMMSSVGYDPYQILDKKDFFTAWVENIWQSSCKVSTLEQAVKQACKQAQSRALRARAQLTTVATQSVLYKMGVQAFIANDYKQARRYFTAYGRDYPNRAVLSALGLSHFAEALTLHRQLIQNRGLKRPAFYYPLLLDATVTEPSKDSTPLDPNKRSAMQSIIKQQQKEMRVSIERSIDYFEKAIRLEPDYPKSYLMVALSYLLDGNTFMARGIIQGKYRPKFGNDVASDLMLAMISAIEGDKTKATKSFEQIISRLQKPLQAPTISADLLVYSAYYNSAAYANYLGNHARAKRLWKQLASQSKSSGNSVLFRLALSHVIATSPQSQHMTTAPNIDGLRLGDKFLKTSSTVQLHQINELWIEGEKYKVHRLNNGSRYVIGTDNRIISAWQNSGQNSVQDSGQASLNGNIAFGDSADRSLKSLGIPTRQLHVMSGEYLAYDDYGVAVHIVQNKVAGWFLYDSR